MRWKGTRVQPLSGPPWLEGQPVGESRAGEELKLIAPVEPSKIVCIGLNYHAHVQASYSADEAPENPLIFLKPPSAIIGPEDLIHHPPASERVDYEGFDTFCPIGPWIVTGIDYRDLLVEGVLNGKVMQSGRTAQMIFPIDFLISYVSSVMTLNPGDLICTGTPSGISPMKSRDTIEVRIEHVGSLVNHMAG